MKHLPRFIALLFSIAILLPSFAQKNKTVNRFAGLDTALTRVLKEAHAAGFAVAVVEKKLEVTPNTLFATGSCTKAFTTSLLGMLNKEGKVDFDKPVRTYLPAVKFYNNEMTDKITLRDRMSHRTGLPRHDLSCTRPAGV